MNKLSDKELKKYLFSLVEVDWQDPKTFFREKSLLYESENLKSLLQWTVSYGILEKFDKDCISIVTEYSGDEQDFTIIPRNLIVSIEKFTSVKKIKGGKK